MSKGNGYEMCLNKKTRALCLGSGNRPCKDTDSIEWTNLDSAGECKPDVVCNVGEEPLPFRDDTFDFIFSEHAVEHFSNIHEVLKEMYRVTVNGGRWRIIVPYSYTHQDHLFHQTVGWYKGSFNKYLVDSGRKYYHNGVQLELLSVKHRSVGWKRLIPFKTFLSQFLNNIIYELEYNLKVIKQ